MDRSSYGGPPQSTIGNSARRIQAQLPAEPPACVQNAMMRRDKQPFTYTPGGIDLSQIKSPRMAKRISRNANSEGVTGQPKVSPLAQNNGSSYSSNGTSSSNGNTSSVSPAATLGAAAMGMPFQVFPTGPPAPPPPPPPTAGRVLPSNGGNRSIPPPPPPPGPAQPTASSSDARKSPRPQSFEPPPMGMRPEIKIPPNPMAALRKAPRPQPKNDFWIEEYRREKQQDERPQQIPRPVPPSYSYTNRDLDDEVAKNTFNRTDELTVRGDHPLAQHHHRSPSPSNLTVPHESGSRGSSSIKTPPVYGQSPVPANLPPPITPTKVSAHPPATKDSPPPPPPPVRPKPSLSPVSTSNQYSGSTTPTPLHQPGSGSAGKEQTAGVKAAAAPPPPPPQPPHASSASSSHKDTAQSSGVSPSVSSASSPGSPNQSPSSAKPTSTQRPAAQALGSLYIPPIHEVFANSKQSLLTQASPPWMSSRHNSLKEQPEWVHKDEQDSTTNTNATQSPEQSVEQEQSSKPPASSASGSPRAPSVAKESVAATSKPVDSIVTAPTAVSARQAVPSQPLTPNSNRSAAPAADVSNPVQHQQTGTASAQQQQQYGSQQQQQQQQQQAGRATGGLPAAGTVSSTVTMPVNRGYPQQAPVYAQAQPVYSTQSPAGTQKERIIPIQIEKSPVQAPVTAPTFAPPPYYSPSAQYGPASAQSSMQSPIAVGFATPHSGFTTPTAMFTNPNHFVNQGYNNISYPPTPTGQPHPHYQHHQHYAPPQTPPMHHPMHPQAQQQRMQQSTPTQQGQQVTNVRIVPIKVESGSDHTTVRGPLSNTPAIIQSGDRSYVIHDIPLEAKLRFLKNRLSDPRSSSNAQSWNGNNAPNQSRSFRVLQQITDTLDEAEAEKNAKEQSNNQSDQADGAKQQYSRSTAQQQDAAEGQLRRLQLSNEDKALMNRVKNQGSGNRAQQMFNKANYNDSDGDTQQSQQYVPPSEQKVEEPKKYTGGSIPSRSFKMLQAMTDAPGPGETDF